MKWLVECLLYYYFVPLLLFSLRHYKKSGAMYNYYTLETIISQNNIMLSFLINKVWNVIDRHIYLLKHVRFCSLLRNLLPWWSGVNISWVRRLYPPPSMGEGGALHRMRVVLMFSPSLSLIKQICLSHNKEELRNNVFETIAKDNTN